ncbi:hypothetical protein PSPO01_11752 [Paraphaeosphaeria sporulosa]
MTVSARSWIISFSMIAMRALAAVLLTFSTISQASLSEHGTPTATAECWTPRKPYAGSIAFPQVPLISLSSGSLGGTLFERQNSETVWKGRIFSVLTFHSGAQCSSTTGAEYSCPGNATCVSVMFNVWECG